MKQYYIYILTNRKNGTLYIGVTSNLFKRVQEHKDKIRKSFTQKYNVNRLVYYEIYFDIQTALEREKNLKKWKRSWKIKIIEKMNPLWRDINTRFPPP